MYFARVADKIRMCAPNGIAQKEINGKQVEKVRQKEIANFHEPSCGLHPL